MMKGINQKTLLISGIIILLIVVLVGIILVQSGIEIFGQSQYKYQEPSPEMVVRQYFTAWSSRDWPDMYATISDGFKRIEPTARDLNTFRNYSSSQHISGVTITSIKEISRSNETATVGYSVEFIATNGTIAHFSGTFTLKYRPGDVIRGWKLVHPYGANIDSS